MTASGDRRVSQDESEPDTAHNVLLAQQMLKIVDDATKWELAKGLQAAGQLQIPVDLSNFIGVVDPGHELIKDLPAAGQLALHGAIPSTETFDASVQAPSSNQPLPSPEASVQEFLELIQSAQSWQHLPQHVSATAPCLQSQATIDPVAMLVGGFPPYPTSTPTSPYLAALSPPSFPAPIQLRLGDMGLQDAPSSSQAQVAIPPPALTPPVVNAAAASEDGGKTTVVLQQIGAFTKNDLIAHVEQFGFPQGITFDFLYYPSNFDKAGVGKSKAHHGYAIINFVNSEIAIRFMEMHGSEIGKSRRGGDFTVKWANVQGFEANATRYIKRHDRIRDPGLRPMMWINGSHEGMVLTKENLPADVLERIGSRIKNDKNEKERAHEERVRARERSMVVDKEQADAESDEVS